MRIDLKAEGVGAAKNRRQIRILGEYLHVTTPTNRLEKTLSKIPRIADQVDIGAEAVQAASFRSRSVVKL